MDPKEAAKGRRNKPDSVAHGKAVRTGDESITTGKQVEREPAEKDRAMPTQVLHHIEIHPAMAGGVRVEHHHHPMQKDGSHIKVHEFEPHQGPLFHSHLETHTGMGMEETAAQDEGEAAKEKSQLAKEVSNVAGEV